MKYKHFLEQVLGGDELSPKDIKLMCGSKYKGLKAYIKAQNLQDREEMAIVAKETLASGRDFKEEPIYSQVRMQRGSEQETKFIRELWATLTFADRKSADKYLGAVLSKKTGREVFVDCLLTTTVSDFEPEIAFQAARLACWQDALTPDVYECLKDKRVIKALQKVESMDPARLTLKDVSTLARVGLQLPDAFVIRVKASGIQEDMARHFMNDILGSKAVTPRSLQKACFNANFQRIYEASDKSAARFALLEQAVRLSAFNLLDENVANALIADPSLVTKLQQLPSLTACDNQSQRVALVNDIMPPVYVTREDMAERSEAIYAGWDDGSNVDAQPVEGLLPKSAEPTYDVLGDAHSRPYVPAKVEYDVLQRDIGLQSTYDVLGDGHSGLDAAAKVEYDKLQRGFGPQSTYDVLGDGHSGPGAAAKVEYDVLQRDFGLQPIYDVLGDAHSRPYVPAKVEYDHLGDGTRDIHEYETVRLPQDPVADENYEEVDPDKASRDIAEMNRAKIKQKMAAKDGAVNDEPDYAQPNSSANDHKYEEADDIRPRDSGYKSS